MPRAALVVAHPGHELRVHGWLEREKPLVFVLTDGSGSAGVSRVDSSRRVLEAAGARPAPVFGAFSDRELYAALLGGDTRFFLELVRRIVGAFVENRIDTVVGDAAEGYNSGHDACRLVLNAAVAQLRRDPAAHIDSYDYPVVDGMPANAEPPAMRVSLDDAALERKLRAARSYAGLEGEVASAIDRHGAQALRTELFYRVTDHAPFAGTDGKPFYETYGERQVAAGRYEAVLRFAEHMLPLAKALNGGH
jgi:hypothetical protein